MRIILRYNFPRLKTFDSVQMKAQFQRNINNQRYTCTINNIKHSRKISRQANFTITCQYYIKVRLLNIPCKHLIVYKQSLYDKFTHGKLLEFSARSLSGCDANFRLNIFYVRIIPLSLRGLQVRPQCFFFIPLNELFFKKTMVIP